MISWPGWKYITKHNIIIFILVCLTAYVIYILLFRDVTTAPIAAQISEPLHSSQHPSRNKGGGYTLIIPLAPKHFNYGQYIVNRLHGTGIDYYIIFTNRAEHDEFMKLVGDTFMPESLLLSDFVNKEQFQLIERENTWACMKKFFALLTLYRKYEYIAAIDSEIEILNTNPDDYYNAMKDIATRKIITGGIYYKDILNESLYLMTPPGDHAALKKLSQDNSIYTWWSNLPVFDCKLVRPFFDWIQFTESNITAFLSRLKWQFFDHMAYEYYCALHHGYTIMVTPNLKHSLELCSSRHVEYTDTHMRKLYWVNNYAYKENKEYYKNRGFLIVFHMDRDFSYLPGR
jgi:hypothetical protein